MSGAASSDNPPTPTPTADSRTVSTRLGYAPGTPQPPIDPPRRRSSLNWSQFFTWSTPPSKSKDSPQTPSMPTQPLEPTPSNAGVKRMPPSTNQSDVKLGHVAQMQRLFQSARASLRLDMAFAASPTGSIGSRLPPDKSTPSHDSADIAREDEEALLRDWRYSIAPQLLAATEVDVREPVPEGSPTLPKALYAQDGENIEPAMEPLSSGFNSPAEHDSMLRMRRARSRAISTLTDFPVCDSEEAERELQRTMTTLKVCSDDENVAMEIDESPIVSHLRRMSAESQDAHQLADSEDIEIFLSEPAEAAAESAKKKRSLLRRFFPRRTHSSTPSPPDDTPSPTEQLSVSPSCPDPTLHKLMEMGVCPDPAAHLRSTPPELLHGQMLAVTPDANLTLAQQSPSPLAGPWVPPLPPFHRANSTGSPMPFIRPHTASSPGPRYYSDRMPYYDPSPHALSHMHRPHRPHTRNNQPGMASEHFQPGWYYAQEPAQASERLNPMTYSFSTAAAKIVGQSAAPDSRIRDSYRTDTLTPLAKPASRFRKTGLGALAGNLGISKHYCEPERQHSRATRPGTSQSNRTHENVQFRSSPPRASENMSHTKRRRPKELEDEQFDIHEDEVAESMSAGRMQRVNEEPIEVDENTRAAVRMSLYGSEMPGALQAERKGIRELSPNVMSTRKGMRQPRKKRRPSYWDGDLKQIRESPANRQDHVKSIQPGAERRVTTSPAQEDVKSVRISVRGNVNVGVDTEDTENREGVPGEVSEDTAQTSIDHEQSEAVDVMEIKV